MVIRLLRSTRVKLFPVALFMLLSAYSFPDGTMPAPIPRNFRGIALGMDMASVKAALTADPYFRYRGDPDVSLLPSPNKYLIECEGTSFISRAYFQFHDGRLYIMTLVLDPKLMDYFTMYTTLKGKYGDETRLSPGDAVWESTSTRLSLERPVGVKYIDVPVFEKLLEGSRAGESAGMISRDTFIKEF